MDSKGEYFCDKPIFLYQVLGHVYLFFKFSAKISNSYFQTDCTFKTHFDRVNKLMQEENGASVGKLINVANIITFSYACRRTIDFD